MAFQDAVYTAGYISLAALGILLLGNAVIAIAQLSGHRAVANQVRKLFIPVAYLFRVGGAGSYSGNRR